MAFRILTNRNLSISDLRSIVAGQTGNLIVQWFDMYRQLSQYTKTPHSAHIVYCHVLHGSHDNQGLFFQNSINQVDSKWF